MDILGQIEGEVATLVDDCYNVRHLVHFLEGYRSRVRQQHDNPYAVGSARYYSFKAGYERAQKDVEE